MNYETIIKQLEQYNEHEQLYKEYFSIKNSPDRLACFLSQLDSEKIKKEHILIPEPTKKMNFKFISDEIFTSDYPERSIFLQKHNRYTPYFSHSHNFFELLYVYSGTAQHIVDGKNTTLSTGDLCIISPGTTHSLGVFDQSIVINALIRSNAFNHHFFKFLKDDNILSSFFLNNLYTKKHINYITFHTNNDSELQQLLLEMFLEHDHKDAFSDGILNNQLMIFFSKLLRGYKDSVQIPTKISKKNEKMLHILNYIQSNYQKVTLTELSDYFHFTAPYISALIKESTGQTFSAILQKIRLDRATDLLLNTNLSINDICEEIGYANPPHFIRLFTMTNKLSPSQYRKLKHQ